MNRNHRAASRRGMAIALLLVPGVLVAAALAVQLAFGPALDTTVVTHWGIEGPDGWGPAWTYPLLVAAVGLGIPALAWASTRAMPGITDAAVLTAAIVLWLSAFLAVGATWWFVDQDADRVGLGALVAAVAGLGLAIGAWLLVPRDPAERTGARTPAPLDAPPGSLAAWTSTVSAPAGLIVLVVVLILAVGVGGFASAAGGGPLIVVVLGVALLLVLATMLRWRVHAGPTGLTVRSMLGWPVFRIPVSQIERVELVDVQAFAEFGGWGLRFAPGGPDGRARFGVVVRSGPAIQVIRHGGRAFVVTVPDAADGAAALRNAVPGPDRFPAGAAADRIVGTDIDPAITGESREERRPGGK